jgi:tRNA(Ile)-lysidine synthase
MRWIQINASSLRPLSPGARYLIGVSGGRDSVALLHWLVECGYNKLIVCHLNHRLRGRSSRTDAIFVQKLAAKYDVDLALGAIDVRARQFQSIVLCARPARCARAGRAHKTID